MGHGRLKKSAGRLSRTARIVHETARHSARNERFPVYASGSEPVPPLPAFSETASSLMLHVHAIDLELALNSDCVRRFRGYAWSYSARDAAYDHEMPHYCDEECQRETCAQDDSESDRS